METTIRATPREHQAQEWALVLTAVGIPHRVDGGDAAWAVVVPADDAARARAALEAYDEETRRPAPAPVPEAAPADVAWTLGLLAAAGLLAFFAALGPAGAAGRWVERGAAAAGAITGGEPWRIVTALMLHVDIVHVAGNAVATAILLPPVVQRLGPGVGLWLVLLAGAGGNLLAAFVHDPRHVAVGASTATFGAIGILAALRLALGRGGGPARRRPSTVVIACLALLALLGAGRDADVVGHAAGLVAGAVLGLAGAPLARRPPGPVAQSSLAGGGLVAVVACWRLALAGAPG